MPKDKTRQNKTRQSKTGKEAFAQREPRSLIMLYPTIDTLSKREHGEPLNRYELVIGVAKSARMVTDEFIAEFNRARQMVENHETDRPIVALISPELRQEKAVHIAIERIENHEYTLDK